MLSSSSMRSDAVGPMWGDAVPYSPMRPDVVSSGVFRISEKGAIPSFPLLSPPFPFPPVPSFPFPPLPSFPLEVGPLKSS